MYDKKLKHLKESTEKLNDKELTILLLSGITENCMKKGVQFSVSELILRLAMVVQKLVRDGIISRERGFDLAGSAAEIIGEFLTQQKNKEKEMND